MSHQTGIRANSKLRNFLTHARDGSIRAIKVTIENEELTYSASSRPRVLPSLDELPCYILYRFDSKTSAGYQWLFIAWSPDSAPVRQKMLYAATRATMKSEFGGGQIKDEIFGTVQSDVSLAGYRRHVQSALAPAPLTLAEEELQLVKQNELETAMAMVNANAGVDSRFQTMPGFAFPLSADAEHALASFKNGAINYVQLSLDLKKEVVNLAAARNIQVDQLISQVPTENASYHLFNFSHTHEGDFLHSTVFIYSMPGYKCPIRERMLYSSCKNPLVNQLASMGIAIEKNIEVDDPAELTEQFIYEEVHPKKNVARQAFAKPKGPAGRGPKRMTKPSK
ncbi:unnamed protein product [Candidula unifasciata]|uniref:Twinfilin n=1 Tax=Candidula unifasciata TaxID=100452 RepID=A0A8S3ZCW3_9EUPU|nr:unnamed protein product [Candidula unifasciata]